MSNLLEALQEVDPTAPASMADDLRACLVAINRQAQAEPPSTEWSLNAWWRWLDDEGYNREAFAEVLQRLGAARISEAQLTNLVATCGTRGDEPNGLALFQELLHEIDEDSLDLLHHFEALALTEEHELVHEAGGGRTNLSTRQKVEIGVGVPLAVGGIVGTGFAYRAWQSRRAIINPDQIRADADKALINEKIDLRHKERADKALLASDVRSIGNDNRGAADKTLRRIEKNPQKYREISVDAYNNTKSIEHYTSKDIEDRASHLLSEHAKVFIDDAVQQRLLNEYRKAADYRPWDVDATRFEQKFQAFSEESYARIHSEEMNKVEEAYKTLVSLEVEAAKTEARKAKEDASTAFDDMLTQEDRLINEAKQDIGDVIKASEVKIDEDVIRAAQKAKAAARGAWGEGEEDLIEIEESL